MKSLFRRFMPAALQDGGQGEQTGREPVDASLRVRVAGLDRVLTAQQLAWRKWTTRSCLTVALVLPGAVLAFLLWSGGWQARTAAEAGCVLTALVAAFGLMFWPFGIPAVWRPVDDYEMVQLLEMARFYPRVQALVRHVNELGRDFALQDWLQARAIEAHTGQDRKALQAADADRRRRADSVDQDKAKQTNGYSLSTLASHQANGVRYDPVQTT